VFSKKIWPMTRSPENELILTRQVQPDGNSGGQPSGPAGFDAADEVAALHAKIDQLTDQLAALGRLVETALLSSPLPIVPSPKAAGRAEQQNLPPFPTTKDLRRVLRNRALRTKHFPGDLFADPAWDMLLDLAASIPERRRVSVTSLCLAAGVPTTTALRWIGLLVDAGFVERGVDAADRRRVFVTLTDRAIRAMARYFGDIAPESPATI
jgi:DNA-binding MarR family transcriptional regulator